MTNQFFCVIVGSVVKRLAVEISCGKENTMMNTVNVLGFIHREYDETLRADRKGLNLIRSNEIEGKRKRYKYH